MELTICMQVNARANQLAHHLIASGTGLGSAVGLLLEPSIDAIVAMLAVLKAGCCYLPLAQHRSDAALALIAEDASLAEVIAHRGLQARALKCLRVSNMLTGIRGMRRHADRWRKHRLFKK